RGVSGKAIDRLARRRITPACGVAQRRLGACVPGRRNAWPAFPWQDARQPRLCGNLALRHLRCLPITLLVISLSWPGLAWAMRQCPPEFGEKSTGFWLQGWMVFALFVIAGILLPILMFRATRQAPRVMRWWLRAASFPAMLALW